MSAEQQVVEAVERLRADAARLTENSGYAVHFGTPRTEVANRYNDHFAADLRLVLSDRDNLLKEVERLRADFANACDVGRRLEAAKEAAEATAAEMREALEPFAGDKLPSARKTECAYNRHGLRCLMSPLEIARDRAFRALSLKENGNG